MQVRTPESLLAAAKSLLAMRDVSAAVAAFDHAQAQGAHADECAGGRWVAHMLAGHFAAAWRESDAIRERGAPDPHRFWAGEELVGQRVMLRCLHGFGDAVQWLRYAPRLAELASRLIVEVPPALVEIACAFPGVNNVITWGEGAPGMPAQWDVQVEVTELPYLFRTEARDLPIAEQYLHLPSHLTQQAARFVASSARRRRVGIVWAAGEWNPERSLPLELLADALQTSDCEFWSLQGGRAQTEGQQLRHPLPLRDASGFGDGVLPLAAVIEQMDLVITVDTLAAHLAGAMNKPAWVLLQYAADWRWMLERSDSLWYPSLRLFRQAVPGEWQTVIENIGRALMLWTKERAA